MSKKIKLLVATLLTGVTFFSVGCTNKYEVEEVNKQVQEAVGNLEMDELRSRLIEECNNINNDDRHPWATNFRIDEEKDEIRFVIIAFSDENKFTLKSDMNAIHKNVYNVVKRINKYEGNLYTDFCIYNQFTETYTVYNIFTYATNGDQISIPVKYEYNEYEFLNYYNN